MTGRVIIAHEVSVVTRCVMTTVPYWKQVLQIVVLLFVKMEDTQITQVDALLQKRVAEVNKKMEKTPAVIIRGVPETGIKDRKKSSLQSQLKNQTNSLKLQVDIGGEIRQIVAGTQQFLYTRRTGGKRCRGRRQSCTCKNIWRG